MARTISKKQRWKQPSFVSCFLTSPLYRPASASKLKAGQAIIQPNNKLNDKIEVATFAFSLLLDVPSNCQTVFQISSLPTAPEPLSCQEAFKEQHGNSKKSAILSSQKTTRVSMAASSMALKTWSVREFAYPCSRATWQPTLGPVDVERCPIFMFTSKHWTPQLAKARSIAKHVGSRSAIIGVIVIVIELLRLLPLAVASILVMLLLLPWLLLLRLFAVSSRCRCCRSRRCRACCCCRCCCCFVFAVVAVVVGVAVVLFFW